MGKPTIDDVAALAGVARTTVSRVLNNQPNVRGEVREKVLVAVEKLGYRVNVQARNLAGRRTMRIALIHASDFDTEPNSYFSSALELGATRAGAGLGVQLITHVINQNDQGAAAQIVADLSDDQCDGAILTPPFGDDPQLLRTLRGLGIATVAIAGGADVEKLTLAMGIDDFQAGYDIGVHLIGLGHKRFGFVKGLQGHTSAETRFDGFLAALADAGLSEAAVTWRRGNFTFRSGLDLTQSLLADAPDIAALVCANDDMAAGALLAAHKAGKRIPEDLAITGFDDTPVSEIVWPPLTTIHQPLRRMGARAVELLAASAASGKGCAPGREVLEHQLVVRESTAATP
ncbi:MAG: LacI family DNA-binding transcriptional regulator [Novosphingobium sp.]|uniref:LacI family DNA-binding transcriptional regulator n=1 Tax=Novosphingobium sp. TaxID=1874826 RepID=UPI0032B9FE13